MFFRMRRQHAFELNQSLERANMARESTWSSSKGEPSSRGPSSSKSSNRGALEGTGDGDRDGQRCDGSRGEGRDQALSLPPSGNETKSGVRKE